MTAWNTFLAPLLFFALGFLASAVKSPLEIHQSIGKTLAAYLLLAIGLKGGVEIAKNGLSDQLLIAGMTGLLLAFFLPVIWFFLLKKSIGIINAASIAATYGSVSAITFVTAADFLNAINVPYDGFMVAILTLMESPPIIVGVFLAKCFAAARKTQRIDWKELWHESLLNQAVFLLLGGLAIGFCIGESGFAPIKGLFDVPFRGFLCFFLLDLGTLAARRLHDLKFLGYLLAALAIAIPLANACIGIAIAWLAGLSEGNAMLLVILCAGASYIAVPAALSLSLPQASPAIYLTMAVGITFPFNIFCGIAVYYTVIHYIWQISI